MNRQIVERTTALLDNYPGIADYFHNLNELGADWAISASAAVHLLTGNRQPSDIDITITDESFEPTVAAGPLVVKKHEEPATFRCGDGRLLDFPIRGVSFLIGGIAVDVMDTGEARYEDHVYRLGLSPLAVENRWTVPVEGPHGFQTIYLANPFDVVAMKAVMQRGEEVNKFDFSDTQAVLADVEIDPVYAMARAREIGLTEREWSFLGRAGLQANISLGGSTHQPMMMPVQ